ncbi:MAG: hypothetical protein M5R40_07405 [Anaerolineae bacterium]|nr:hypothetical protein [Anaerolineae bacterium]
MVPDTVLDLPCAIGRGCNTPRQAGQYLLARWPLVDDARPGGREGDLCTPALCQFHLDATVSALDPNQAYIAEPLALGIPLRVGFAFGRSDSPPILARVRDERLNGGPLVVEARAAAPFLRAVFAHWVERRYPAARIVPQANENPYYASYMIATADAPVWAHGLQQRATPRRVAGLPRGDEHVRSGAFAERLSALDLPAPRIVQLLTPASGSRDGDRRAGRRRNGVPRRDRAAAGGVHAGRPPRRVRGTQQTGADRTVVPGHDGGGGVSHERASPYIVCPGTERAPNPHLWCTINKPPSAVRSRAAGRARTPSGSRRFSTCRKRPIPPASCRQRLMARITRAAALLQSVARWPATYADARLIGAALDVLTGGDKARAANGLDCAPLVAGARDWMAEAEKYANHHEPVLALLW